ncbi:hypothetical protein P4S72_19630 [Vibrio sp. PP-XX7]
MVLIAEEESSVFARQRDGRFGMILMPHGAHLMTRMPSLAQCGTCACRLPGAERVAGQSHH